MTTKLGILAFLLLSISAFAQGPTCPPGVSHCAVGSWAAPLTGDPATGYNVYRSVVSGGCTSLTASTCTKVGSTALLTFLDSPLVAATTYFWVITATNAGGESLPSAQVFGTTGAPTLPGTPGSFTIQVK